MTSEEQLVSRELYGGAITLHLPARFADISDFRPVPDHQEVWADASADDSLVLEIVEQDPSVTDAGCGMHYWNDLVAANDSTAAEMQGVTALGPADIPQLPPGSVRYACLVSGSMAASKGRQSAAAANRIAVLLAAVRLPSVKSDLLLTLHSPIVISSESQAAEHAGAGVKQRYIAAPLLFSSILASLILDSGEGLTGQSDLQRLISHIPFRRLAIWGSVAFLAYQLSDFFGIMMGTFIIAFIGNGFVESSENAQVLNFVAPSTRRKALVILYFTLIFAMVTLFGVMTIPDIASEGVDFVNRLQSDNIWVVLVEKMRAGLGDQIMESLEKAIYLASSADITLAAGGGGTGELWTAERSVALGMAVSSMLKGYTTTAAKVTGQLLSSVTKFAVQIVVSLVLGFMLVWDSPTISAGVASLRSSRLSPIYNEVAPSLSVFGKLFGKALEAQARIAAVNTALTAAGMWLLQIPGMGLLSLFVFVCSFIPIAGCIISTIPIGFVALTEYGFFKLALVILMVILVHFVEAYMLNPAIYSAHLKLHPLMVLSVLVVAEHSLGIWGLLLAVPSTVFALDYCIKYPDSSVTEVGEKELSKVMQSRDDEEYGPAQAGAGAGPGGGGGRARGYRPPSPRPGGAKALGPSLG